MKNADTIEATVKAYSKDSTEHETPRNIGHATERKLEALRNVGDVTERISRPPRDAQDGTDAREHV